MYSMELIAVLLMAFVFGGYQSDGQKISPTFVAFSVGKTAHQLGKGRVVFQKVFLNLGNGYDIRFNEFVAPVAGVYVISVSAANYRRKNVNREVFIDLYKNQEYLVSLYESKDIYGQAYNSITIKLSVGDKMYVNARRDECGLYGSTDQVYSTFTGYLVAPYYKVFNYVAGLNKPN